MAVSPIQSAVSLAPMTTLGVGGQAKFFTEVTTNNELEEAIKYARSNSYPWTILGGGSNTLVLDSGYAGLVIKMSITGITKLPSSDPSTIYLQVGAGTNFDGLVAYCVEHNYWGLENLSAIPGTVGATPVQNVGAYGVEVSQVITSVMVYDSTTNTYLTLTNHDCRFGYRTSIFKQQPNRYVIVAVVFKLTTNGKPKCEYRDLANYFTQPQLITLSAIRQAVIKIRSQKFPDWTKLGTAGSFFKNPIVNQSKAKALLKQFPDLPNYPVRPDQVKLVLGYILDKICGLKGYQVGAVGLYQYQALVLVAKKNTPTEEILSFVNDITAKVFAQIGIEIELEVTILK